MAKKTTPGSNPGDAGARDEKPNKKEPLPAKEASAAPRKRAAKPKSSAKDSSQAEPLKPGSVARTPEASAKIRKPAEKSAKKSAKTPKEAQPTAKAAAPRKSRKAPDKNQQGELLNEEKSSSGSIKPTVKRPAYLPPINGNLVVRQQRRFAEGDRRSASEQVYDLPRGYDRTYVSALVRDAEWIYVFWEIAPRQREELGLGRSDFNGQLMLRLYDVTGIEFDGVNALGRTDIPVNDMTSSWYVHVPQTERRYVVELGIMGPRGDFMSIARSNALVMPSARISDDVDWEWGAGDEESHLQILRLSGGADIPLHLSSADFVNELRRRFLEESAGFSGELFSGALLGSEFASQSVGGARHQAFSRDRGFWLVVDTEVIVYGATDPNARVKFMGREIKLNPDGTFGIRMALPDGKLEFPIEATSPDEYETRSVCPIVSRKTL